MDRSRYLTKSFGKSPLIFILLVLILLLTIPIVSREGTLCRAGETDKPKIMVRQVAEKWIQVGTEQYGRGLYKEAEQSFLRAMDYQEYLTTEQKTNLNSLLEQTHIAVLERNSITKHIQTANELIEQGELTKAKLHLEKVRDNKFLTAEEQKLTGEKLKKIEEQSAGRKKQIAELYSRSVGLYRSGDMEKAREGFMEVSKSGLFVSSEGQSPEDYLVKIDEILAQGTKAGAPNGEVAAKKVSKARPEAAEAAKVGGTEGTASEELMVVASEGKTETKPAAAVADGAAKEDTGSYIEVVNRQRNILRSHTKAVVNDSITQATNFMSKGEFDKAKDAVETAEQVVNKNQLHLGEELFKEYSNQLKGLSEQILQAKGERAKTEQEQKRVETTESQRRYKEQMEQDRSKRIAELVENSRAYQKQQRYEEALGQMESLLAIDPLNNYALAQKQMLEDTISFRKQLEVQKVADKERADVLVKTEESGIPFAEDITYPRNWREIAATRKSEEIMGMDEASAKVYKQLDEVVDLSMLTPVKPLGEAIELIKNSVKPPLQVTVLWRDLYDNADIDQTTAIKMDPISAVPLNKAIGLLLKSISGGATELGYVVEDGIITIATADALPGKMVTQVFDVTQVLGAPADFSYEMQVGETSGGGGGGGSRGGGGGGGQGGGGQGGSEDLLGTAVIAQRAIELQQLVQEIVEPSSWFAAGGEGTIRVYENRELVVRQTPKNHREVQKLLDNLRKRLGQQVAIEARFLIVTENFLEEIGLDLDFQYMSKGKFGLTQFQQGSASSTAPKNTEIAGSLPDQISPAMTVIGGYGSVLDDLQVSFLLRATQAHRDAKTLNAPKLTVLSGEAAAIRIEKDTSYIASWTFQTDTLASSGVGGVAPAVIVSTANPDIGYILAGVVLNVTPTISNDRKYVLLRIGTSLNRLIDLVPIFAGSDVTTKKEYTMQVPLTEQASIMTRVNVPDGGTLLIGGQKLSADVEMEEGVPVLSKIPLIGRLFNNRSKVKDHSILLILVKPTIMLQEESEEKAVATMENSGI